VQFSPQAETEHSGLCDAADAPSAVSQAQLDELHIAVTADPAE